MIKIFLIETQKIVREGLKVLLEEESDFQVFCSDNKDVKISLLNRLQPNLILISLDNLDERDFDYLNIFKNLQSNAPQLAKNQLKIIVYAGKVNQFILNKALQLGCEGYLLKESSIAELKQAIRSVHNGYKHIGNSVFNQLEQLSITEKSPVDFSEPRLVKSNKYHNTDLISTSSNELIYEELNSSDRELIKVNNQEYLTTKSFTDSAPTIYTKNYLESQLQNWRQNISSNLFLVGLGCIAGVVGIFSVRERAAKTFSPIVRYGLVKGEIVAIKAPDTGTIKQLNYQVGDLVKTDEILAKLESQNNQELEQIINNIAQQIEVTQRQIKSQKQLLAITQSHFDSERQKLEKLLVSNSDTQSQISSNPNWDQAKTNLESSSVANVQAEFQVAHRNYQKLLQLKEQNLVSDQELQLVKQVYIAAHDKLNQVKANQNAVDSNISEKGTNSQQPSQKSLVDFSKSIEEWSVKVTEQENIIKSLIKELNNSRQRLTEVKNTYRQQQLVNIKAPLTGIVYQHNQITNETLNKDQTIIELLDCNRLWVEVLVNDELVPQINLQQSAMLSFGTIEPSLSGRISSLQPLLNYSQNYSESTLNLLPNLKNNFGENSNSSNAESFYKIKIDFSIPDDYALGSKVCGQQETAAVTFNN